MFKHTFRVKHLNSNKAKADFLDKWHKQIDDKCGLKNADENYYEIMYIRFDFVKKSLG